MSRVSLPGIPGGDPAGRGTGIPGGDTGIPGGGPSRPWLVLRPNRPGFPVVPVSERADTKRIMLFLRLAVVLFLVPVSVASHLGGPPASIATFATLVVLGLVGLTLWRRTRIEWDGREIRQRSPLWNRTIGTARQGLIVRAQLQGSPTQLGICQYWLAPDGAFSTLLVESQWDAAELKQMIRQAQIPVVDLGQVTPQFLAEVYPGTRRALGGRLMLGR